MNEPSYFNFLMTNRGLPRVFVPQSRRHLVRARLRCSRHQSRFQHGCGGLASYGHTPKLSQIANPGLPRAAKSR
jgi:hypothetical protein